MDRYKNFLNRRTIILFLDLLILYCNILKTRYLLSEVVKKYLVVLSINLLLTTFESQRFKDIGFIYIKKVDTDDFILFLYNIKPFNIMFNYFV